MSLFSDLGLTLSASRNAKLGILWVRCDVQRSRHQLPLNDRQTYRSLVCCHVFWYQRTRRHGGRRTSRDRGRDCTGCFGNSLLSRRQAPRRGIIVYGRRRTDARLLRNIRTIRDRSRRCLWNRRIENTSMRPWTLSEKFFRHEHCINVLRAI